MSAASRPTAAVRLAGAAAVLLAGMALFLLYDTAGNLDFAVAFRGRTLAALVVVGWATGVSSVVFHTVTGNRILTPSILGLDALYALLQTLLVLVLGLSAAAVVPRWAEFLITAALMTALSLALFWGLFGRGGRSIGTVLLIGVVASTGLRSATTLLQRVMDPTSYLVLQGNLFASFSGVDPSIMAIGAAILAVASLRLWGLRRRLDVVSLGRDVAVGLGLRYRPVVMEAVGWCALMVAVATALVGPITFLGLLVANLAWLLAGSQRHGVVMPMAGLIGAACLVVGQAILQHLLGMGTLLSVVIELVGGVAFILLLLKGHRR